MENKAKTNEYCRPNWDEYFMKITEVIGDRGTCDRGRSGCIIVKDKRIISIHDILLRLLWWEVVTVLRTLLQ